MFQKVQNQRGETRKNLMRGHGRLQQIVIAHIINHTQKG